MKFNKNMNITKLSKTNKTHIYIYMIYTWLCIEEQTYEHLAYMPQIQKEIAYFR